MIIIVTRVTRPRYPKPCVNAYNRLLGRVSRVTRDVVRLTRCPYFLYRVGAENRSVAMGIHIVIVDRCAEFVICLRTFQKQ